MEPTTGIEPVTYRKRLVHGREKRVFPILDNLRGQPADASRKGCEEVA